MLSKAVSGGPSPYPLKLMGNSIASLGVLLIKFWKDVTRKILHICPKHQILFFIHVKLKFQKFEITFFLTRLLSPYKK